MSLLRNGPPTFASMLELIDGARQEVVLEGYIFRRDETGQRFAEALGAAAARGVHVRLLVDWFGRLGTPYRFFRRIHERGVEVKLFSPPSLVRSWAGLVPRDHRKLLVVDGACGITGGIGIGNEWRKGMLKKRASPWRDTAVRIEGPAAKDMVQAFNAMWRRATARERRGMHRSMTRAAQGAHLDPATHAPSLVGIIEGEPGRFRIARALQLQAVSAEKSIWIASAYFVPSDSDMEALAGAARDGVDVRVLVPSRYDHFFVRSFTTRKYRRLLRNSVRVWEWGGEMMHAKMSLVDGRWLRIGSTDFNPLGLSINYELDAVIEDPTLGAEAAAMFESDLKQSREITIRTIR